MIFNKIPGQIYLLIAVCIFAASSSISNKLAAIGMQNLIDGRNPISFCNVLFVGNLFALVVLAIVYGREWNAESLTRLSLINWLILIIVAILSGALAPSLIFFALEQTTASNVVLLGRIQSPLTFALLSLIINKKSNWWIFTGELMSVAGIILILVLQSPGENAIVTIGMKIGRGELLALGGAMIMSIASVARKVRLDSIPLGIFTIFRTAIGTLVFWILVVKLFTVAHFADVFAPIVWQWVSIYGIVIVAGGQIIWFRGLKTSSFSSISYAGYLTPIAGILAAYLILGEIPTAAQYVGGSVILVGAFFSQLGMKREAKKSPTAKQSWDRFIEFRGI